MKKALLLIVIGLVVVAVGANWYYTRQIRNQLDRVADAVSMFGTLSYDNVRLSPGGAINIHDLSYRMHQQRGGIDIGEISLKTAGLMALITLESDLERGRFPESLGLEMTDIEFPLDGALATMARETQGNASPTGVSGGLFNAAGCDGRARFTADDLMHMDYFDIRADIEAHYRLIDGGDRLQLFASVGNHDAGAIDLEAEFDLPSSSLSTREVANSMQDARLASFSLEYEDLGFYERMLAFCADEMSMSESEYIAHHLEAWQQAWSRAGFEAGPDTMAAYESFLADPRQFRVSSETDHGVSFEAIDRYTAASFLERMGTRLVVNYGQPQPLDVDVPGGSPQRAASSEQPAGAEGVASSPETAGTQPARTTEGADTGSSQDSAAQPAPAWVEVEPAGLQAHVDERLRVRMHSGDRHAGRLSRVESDRIHIRVEGTGGYYIRPLALEEISEMQVYDRP